MCALLVEKHASAIWCRLLLGLPHAQCQSGRFSGIQVVDRELQVQLLGHWAARPDGREVVLDPLHRQEDARPLQRDEVLPSGRTRRCSNSR